MSYRRDFSPFRMKMEVDTFDGDYKACVKLPHVSQCSINSHTGRFVATGCKDRTELQNWLRTLYLGRDVF